MNKYISLFALLIMTSCASEQYYHGYNFENTNFDTIKVGVTTRDEIIMEMGSPTSESTFGKKKMIYAGNKVEKIAFFNPKIIEQKVLSIELNENNIVSNIKELTLEDYHKIMFAEDKVEIRGNTLTPVEQIMTNIGKFNKNTPKQ